MRVYFAILLTSALCLGALKKRSLSATGVLAAAFVGLTTASNDNLLFTTVLLAFFISSSLWTKYQARQKMRLDPKFTTASQRDWKQVLCNGGIGSVISLVYQYYFDGRRPEDLSIAERRLMTVLIWAYIGFYACCTADTWASEIGTLSSDWPVLITTWKTVPPGTNGGISKLGLMSSFAGGATVGLAADIALWAQYFYAFRSGALPRIPYVTVGSLLGTLGSVIDSLLGATVQASFLVDKRAVSDLTAAELQKRKDIKIISGSNILSNNMVNVVSSACTTAAAVGLIALLM
ncbi:hypothetical protein IW142_004835 [Coemansia sp. RSA 564]|nr:hypothetical protein IW142_004835 [Coemansia sp. RSA 564]KAJ2292111.1 hypothetical protein IW141_002144 [Coemansia sp. RSA 355]KAJ2425377.1 hypothetical protein IWW41_004409 [Coemansia sp. RSA 2522]KAJ2437966.1 hypothetical protein IWW46_005100 [Coemansia sp. RSA 2440]KAJ2548515.1 hypothetical protein IWW35_004152 [Coemansia sp. RSA 1878]